MERKKTFNVLFWLRKSRTNESLSPLFCRVTIMGQRYEIPTNCHISPASWSAVAQKSLGKTAVDKETNRYIEDLKLQIVQSPNQKIPDRKTKCVIETHLNIKQNVIFGANLKPV